MLIRSLQLGPVSVIAPLTSLFPIVSITLAVLFLNEHLEVVQILVISIALFGASMTVFKPTKFGGISNNLTSGVLLGCVATILIGFEMFFRGALSKQVGWLLSVYVPLIISLSFFGQIAVVRREWPWERMKFGTFFLLCLASLLMVSAFFLFARGTEIAKERGLILVDTKYEFGKDKNGVITLIDEIHTPDSSRYFYTDGYEEKIANGAPQKQLSKEFVRQWLIQNGFQGKEGQSIPEMSEEY